MKQMRLLTAAAVLTLAACSGNSVKTTLGLDRGEPDEFRVVARPPLSVPPEFDLAPPSATAQAPGQQPASKEAASMVFGSAPGKSAKTTASKKTTSAEAVFVKEAGADKADPNIRNEMAEQHYVKEEHQNSSSWWDILSSNPPKKDPVVDASKESQRINQNEASGQPVTDGTTPMEKQTDTGILGRLLGY